MEKIDEPQLKMIQEQLVGKRVRLKGYKNIGPFPNSDIVGNCDFIGYNPHFPTFGLQITIERMPCINIKLSQISLDELKPAL
jgi:hypothetical protein